MKRVLISFFAIIFASVAAAQDSSKTTNNMHRVQQEEGVIMKDGKLLMMKDGQTTPMTSDLTLDNGAIVTADGRVKNKDGTVSTLGEGDFVTMGGTPGNRSRWPQKEKMKKDSSK